MFALVLATLITGIIPFDVQNPSRILWLGTDGSVVACEIVPPGGWSCPMPGNSRGLVLMVGDNRVGYQVVGPAAAAAAHTRPWARIVIFGESGAPDELREIHARLWKPERSAVRLRLTRLARVEDTSVEFLRVTSTLGVVSGNTEEPEAFVEFSGPAIGSTRVSVHDLRQGLSEVPLLVPLASPLTLLGRVQTAAFHEVSGADVELFQPFVGESTNTTPREDRPVILRAVTRSAADGTFSFDHLETGRYQVVATAPDSSRGVTQVRSPAEPAIVTLVSPGRAVGRILRNHVPERGARVRFIPNIETMVGNTDPADLGLGEATSDDEGRFELALPARTAGSVQVVGASGRAIRVPVSTDARSRQVDLGDLSLPDVHRVAVRLLDLARCTPWLVGPLAGLGLTIVSGTQTAGGLTWFDVPEAGEWALDVRCGNQSHAVQPASIIVRPDQPPGQIIDVRAR